MNLHCVFENVFEFFKCCTKLLLLDEVAKRRTKKREKANTEQHCTISSKSCTDPGGKIGAYKTYRCRCHMVLQKWNYFHFFPAKNKYQTLSKTPNLSFESIICISNTCYFFENKMEIRAQSAAGMWAKSWDILAFAL